MKNLLMLLAILFSFTTVASEINKVQILEQQLAHYKIVEITVMDELPRMEEQVVEYNRLSEGELHALYYQKMAMIPIASFISATIIVSFGGNASIKSALDNPSAEGELLKMIGENFKMVNDFTQKKIMKDAVGDFLIAKALWKQRVIQRKLSE